MTLSHVSAVFEVISSGLKKWKAKMIRSINFKEKT
jgi:hypothetical protein